MSSTVFSNNLDVEVNLSVNGRVKAILSPGDTIAIDVPHAATVSFGLAGAALPAPSQSLSQTLESSHSTPAAQTALTVVPQQAVNGERVKRDAKPVTQYRGQQKVQVLRSVKAAAFLAGQPYFDFLKGLQAAGDDGYKVGEHTYRYATEADSQPSTTSSLVSVKLPVNRRSGKRVIQMAMDGTPLRIWESQTIAAEELGIDKSSISKVCNGRWGTAGGFKWKLARAATN